MVKVIETIYNGFRFRSRLEARWAVFFEKMNIKYRYEPEGFDLDGIWYLPDFYLPDYSTWIEIKPDLPTGEEREKAIRLCIMTQKEVVLFSGDVWIDVKGNSFHPYPHNEEELQDLLTFIGDINQPNCWISKDEFIGIDENDEYFGFDKRRGYVWSNVIWDACNDCKHVSFGYQNIVHEENCRSSLIEGADLSRTPYIMNAYIAARQARF